MATNFDLFYCLAGLAQPRDLGVKRLPGYAAGAGGPRPLERPVVLAGWFPRNRSDGGARVRLSAVGLPVELASEFETDLGTPYIVPGSPTISIPAGRTVELSLDGALGELLPGFPATLRAVAVSAAVGGDVDIRTGRGV